MFKMQFESRMRKNFQNVSKVLSGDKMDVTIEFLVKNNTTERLFRAIFFRMYKLFTPLSSYFT